MPLRLPVFVVLIVAQSACAQEPEPAALPAASSVAAAPEALAPSWYRPPATAGRFAPELLSPDGWTYTPTFTPDLRTAYYVRWDAPDLEDPTSIQKLFEARWDEARGRWGTPRAVAATGGWRVDWPHVTPDGTRLLLSTNKPHDGHYQYPDGRPSDDFDLWGADRLDDGPDGEPRWSAFRPLVGQDLNRQKTPENARIRYVHNETSPRTDRDGRLYFWTERLDDGGGRRDVYTAEPDGEGGYLAPTLLPFNTPARESGVAVGPSGDWVVFASEGRGGEGGSDLFLVVRQGEGWGRPVNLGASVNSAADEGSPEVTPDGRTLFFTVDRPVLGVAVVDAGEAAGPPAAPYWVDLSGLEVFREAVLSR